MEVERVKEIQMPLGDLKAAMLVLSRALLPVAIRFDSGISEIRRDAQPANCQHCSIQIKSFAHVGL